MNGSFDISTVVFAILAIFVVWKLRSVLGTRTGNERPPLNPFARRTPADPAAGASGERGTVITLPGAADRAAAVARKEPEAAERWRGFAEPGSPVGAGLDAVAAGDPGFDPRAFMNGATAAYELIIMAFAKGDRPALQPLLARDVFEGFASAIEAREARSDSVETTFVGIDKAAIEDARMRGKTAQISVRFNTKLITMTRNKAGDIIEGSPETVSDVDDLWTFARDLTSRDPNWLLVATETAQ